MKRVFGSYNQQLVHHAKNLLEAAGIRVLIRNQYLSSAMGELPPAECEAQVWVLDEREHLVEQRVERGVGVAGLLRRRPAQRGPQFGGVADPDRRKVADRLEVLDDAIDEAVAEAAHLVGRQGEHRRMFTRLGSTLTDRSDGGDRLQRHRRESPRAPRASR